MLFFSIISGSEFLQVLLDQLLHSPRVAQSTGQSPVCSCGKQISGASPQSFSGFSMFLKVSFLPVDFSCADHSPDQGLRVPKVFSFPVTPCLKSYSSQGSVVHLFLSHPWSAPDIWAVCCMRSVCWWLLCSATSFTASGMWEALRKMPEARMCLKIPEGFDREGIHFTQQEQQHQNSHHSYAKLQEEEQHKMWEQMLRVSWKWQNSIQLLCSPSIEASGIPLPPDGSQLVWKRLRAINAPCLGLSGQTLEVQVSNIRVLSWSQLKQPWQPYEDWE